MKRLQTFDVCLFIGQDSFAMPVGLKKTLIAWKSKGLSNEIKKFPTTATYSLSPKLKWYYSKMRVEYKGNSLKQDKRTFTSSNIVNFFIVYESEGWSKDLKADITLKDCYFWGC